jgi:hypothetical protein
MPNMALPAIDEREGNRMTWCRHEPTVAEMLSDSIVQAVMEADGVDPKALEALLRFAAEKLAAVREAG